jgi:hypothetical protein
MKLGTNFLNTFFPWDATSILLCSHFAAGVRRTKYKQAEFIGHNGVTSIT